MLKEKLFIYYAELLGLLIVVRTLKFYFFLLKDIFSKNFVVNTNSSIILHLFGINISSCIRLSFFQYSFI